jgi:hypothetical protein
MNRFRVGAPVGVLPRECLLCHEASSATLGGPELPAIVRPVRRLGWQQPSPMRQRTTMKLSNNFVAEHY